MRILKTTMTLDNRYFEVNFPIEEKPTLKEYIEVLEATQKAMLRLIKKEFPIAIREVFIPSHIDVNKNNLF